MCCMFMKVHLCWYKYDLKLETLDLLENIFVLRSKVSSFKSQYVLCLIFEDTAFILGKKELLT